MQIFFARLEVFGDELGFELHQDQHVPVKVTRSRAARASDWRRPIKSYASSGNNRKAMRYPPYVEKRLPSPDPEDFLKVLNGLVEEKEEGAAR